MGKGRVLIIEDDSDNRALVCFLLQSDGYEVIQANDGLEGLEKITLHHPDLVLLDMSIPEIDGWKLARYLKDQAETKMIPVVALTGHTMPGDRQKALDAGCDGYITKPLDIEGFTSLVAGYLNQGSSPE